ncbi:uncharacterized protein LOC110372853 [Helicoverpa armigera]|uniref:uncharacterized protein LOC110372853 n=1 Tax=Helicoverpa armigera TaxID=29058 RepID=UPI003082E01C
MCYICSCVAWGLDLLQRVITFGLTCILSCAVCFGLAIAIIAGVAYGYNYSMAEFITFQRSDVTVFMRRGQFYDKPEISSRYRRTGDEDDLFGTNITTDYEDSKPPAQSKPLADTWLKTQDTRKYAEILTRYNPQKRQEAESALAREMETQESEPVKEPPIQAQAQPAAVRFRPTPESPVISIIPNPMIPTMAWRSGSSEIVMRNFQPLHDFTTAKKFTNMPENLFPTRVTGPKSIPILSPKEQAKESADDKLRDEFHKSYVPMRVWGTTARAVIPDDPDDVDEDAIVYKPV